jgi:3'-phosphoadenosine 5'-phosphosulfate (PAPS) 3'-phosphatase
MAGVSELQPLLEAVRQAAELCRWLQDSEAGPQRKADATLVTLADYGAQALLCRAVGRHFPGDAVIAEESGEGFLRGVPPEARARVVRRVAELLGEPVMEEDFIGWLEHGRQGRAERTWVIDPVDGTEGFVAGRAYAVCIGSLEVGEPRVGVIGVPRSPLDEGGTIFYTAEGGARAEPLGGGEARELRVSEREEAGTLRAVESWLEGGWTREGLGRVYAELGVEPGRVGRYDGMVKYALVAAGEAEVYVRGPRDARHRPPKVWDHVAGTALVRAAGGRVTRLDGGPVDFTRGRELEGTVGLLVSNGRVHARLVEAVARGAGEDWGVAR